MSELDHSPLILVVDDDADLRYSLCRVLSARNCRVLEAGSGEEGVEVAEEHMPEVILLDNRMSGYSGIETLQHLRARCPQAMVILMTAFGTTQTAIEAMKFGAFDYVIKPFDPHKIVSLIEAALRAYRDNQEASRTYQPLLNSEDYKEGIVGQSEPMQRVFKMIGQVAATDVTVLITGESGTGKELVARCLHQHSLRSQRPFIAVNCAAIPEDLIESELFGHEKGAFTGAIAQRIGKFEACDGGTIFLDEIGDMSLPTQTKVLRAIQEGEIQRVGSNATLKVNVRLVAATNRDLEQMVATKAFREDLYYRLNVVRLRLPALRERKEDIPSLVDYILQRLSRGGKEQVRRVSPDVLSLLRRYSWPGNVRELENVLHRSLVVAQGDSIQSRDLPKEVIESAGQPPVLISAAANGVHTQLEAKTREAESSLPQTAPELFDALYRQVRTDYGENILAGVERQMTERALRETQGNQVKAAAILGITRTTLRKRIEQWRLKTYY